MNTDKKRALLTGLLLGLAGVLCVAQSTRPVQTTSYTDGLLRTTSASAARTYLGVGSGSGDVVFSDFNQDWFDTNSPVSLTNVTFTNISLKTGITVENTGSLTNLYDLLNLGALAEGDIIWFDGAGLAILSAGSDNQVLTLDGATLGWEDSAGGGGGNTFNATQFQTNASSQVEIKSAVPLTNIASSGTITIPSAGTIGLAGASDADTGIVWDGSDQMTLNAGGSAKLTIASASASFSVPVTIIGNGIAATSFTLSGGSGNRPAYWNGSGQVSEAALFSVPGNTGDVDVARMTLLASASAAATTFRTLSGTNGVSVENHTTNLVIGVTNNLTVPGDVLADGSVIRFEETTEMLAASTDTQVIYADDDGNLYHIQGDTSTTVRLNPSTFIETLIDDADAATARTTLGVTRVGVYRTLWVDAGAMVTRTTSGAATGLEEYASNDVMSDYLAFDDSTDEFAQCRLVFDNWAGGQVKIKFYWSSDAASGNVIWAIQGGSLANDDAIDTAFGTAVTVTDGVTAADDLLVSSATGAITIAGSPAAEDAVWFQIYRDADDGSDTMSGDAKLLGILVQYLEDSTEDSSW